MVKKLSIIPSLIALYALFSLISLFRLQVSNFKVSVNETIVSTSHPANFSMNSSEEAKIDLEFSGVGPSFLTREISKIEIFADDCLTDLKINGQSVSQLSYPLCSYPHYRTISIGEYLTEGKNRLEAKIKNNSGLAEFSISSNSYDPVLLILKFFAVALVTFIAWQILRFVGNFGLHSISVAVTLFLIGFRVIYYFGTKPFARGFDTHGHLEYIFYIYENFRLPAANYGWETWQPPLYYVISALWLKFGSVISYVDIDDLAMLQGLCLLMSISTIFGFAYLAGLLLQGNQNRYLQPLFLTSAGLFPGLFMLCARINNDSLFNTLAIFVLVLLVRWLKKPSPALWKWMILLICLAFYTKSTAVILIGVACCTPFLRTDLQMKRRWTLSIVTGMALVVINSGYVVYRTQFDNQKRVLGNLDINHQALFTNDTNIRNYFAYNPIAVTQIPFVSSRNDATRRKHFFEYYLRSSLFSEFQYPHSYLFWARGLVVLLNVMFLPFFFGLFSKERSEHFIIDDLLKVTLIISLTVHLCLRILTPIPALADFRYTAFVAVPFVYFCVKGIESLPRNGRRALLIAVWVFNILAMRWLWVLALGDWYYSQV